MNKVFVSRKIQQPALALLEKEAQVDVWPLETPPSEQTFIEKASQVDALFTLLSDPISDAVIQAGKQAHLKVISQMAVGFDNIAVRAATAAGIPVGHTPGVLTETTADFAWALLMAAARRVVESHNEVQQGIWRAWGPEVLCGADVFGATLGLIGFGRIGQAMARRASGFNMKVLYTQRHRDLEAEQRLNAQFVPLEELLQRADFVSLHAYLSPETKGLMGAAQFAQMKPGAIFVNTARGAMVDAQALYNALVSGHLAAAALDVFDPEPIPAGHPLLRLPNVVITPHIGSASTQTRARMAIMTAENILAGLSGKRLPYCANPEVYELS
ncbi:MAG: D-glycerate dehydrogenase [Anaerolineaceae bacterium]|nr:D-glycerate dehydrogenase [Anaerolineaceae bacterium]